MDPTVTLHRLRDPGTDPDERHELALDLANWLYTGGFVPAGETRRGLLDEIDDILTRALPDPAPDHHLEAAYEDRATLGADQ